MSNFVTSLLCFVVFVLGVLSPAALAAGKQHDIVLGDFETQASLDLWTGLPHAQTNEHASSGTHGMTFTMPKYVEGQDERPGVALPFARGKGFPSRDFSEYDAISADVWVVGDKPGNIGLALRDINNTKSYTPHFPIEPGKVNHIELPMREARADCDYRHVKEVLLYSVKPETSYTLVVDNVRVTPRATPPLAEFDLVYPNYRGLVFPGEDAVDVSVHVTAREHGLARGDVAVALSLDSGAVHSSNKSALRSDDRFTVPVNTLPDGPATLTASVVRKRDGATLASKQWQLRKLSIGARDALKVYIDRSGATIVDGKPFFPLGWYSSTQEELALEIADSPFNTILAYGTDRVPKVTLLHYLDTLQQHNLKLMYCMNDLYPTATFLDDTNWEGIKGNDAISAAIVSAYKDHPALLGWYLNDEIPHKLAPQLTEYYQHTAAADPNHPCFIVLCNRSEFPYFADTTDVFGVDPYPIPQDPITRVSSFMDHARDAVSAHKPVWLVPQAFAWYQYNSKNHDRGHMPTEEELKKGPPPTYDEERCMTYLGLTHGAKGLIYYCYYDLRALPHHVEMWDGMKKIAVEVKELQPVLLSPDDLGAAKMSPKNAPIHTLLKRANGRLYLLAVNGDRKPCHVAFQLKHRLPSQVAVMFENKSVPAHGTHLDADFAPLEVHVYDLGFDESKSSLRR